MLNGKLKPRVSKKSLALKKTTNKDGGSKTAGTVGIASYFQKDVNTKPKRELDIIKLSNSKNTACTELGSDTKPEETPNNLVEKPKSLICTPNYFVTPAKSAGVKLRELQQHPKDLDDAIPPTPPPLHSNTTFTKKATSKQTLDERKHLSSFLSPIKTDTADSCLSESLNKKTGANQIQRKTTRNKLSLKKNPRNISLNTSTNSASKTTHGCLEMQGMSTKDRYNLDNKTSNEFRVNLTEGPQEDGCKKTLSTLEITRKTFKLSRKIKRPGEMVGKRLSLAQKKSDTLSEGCFNIDTDEDNVLATYAMSSTVNKGIMDNINDSLLGFTDDDVQLTEQRKANSLSKNPSDKDIIKCNDLLSMHNTSAVKNGAVNVLDGSLLPSTNNILSNSVFNDTMNNINDSLLRFVDEDTHDCQIKTPVKKLNGCWSAKRFAQKGISPLKKRLSTGSTPNVTKRGLFEDITSEQHSTHSTNNLLTEKLSNSNSKGDTQRLHGTASRQPHKTIAAPCAQPKKEPMSCDQVMTDLLDISLNSLNNEDISELIDGVSWSPYCKGSKDRSMVSPAKAYVRTKSTELSCMTSNLDVNNDMKLVPEELSDQDYRRYLVLEVYRREIMDDVTARGSEKVLRLFDESRNSERHCQLREDWERTNVEHGDIVNIIGKFTTPTSYILDNKTANYMIVHPDMLVTPTSISSSTKCLRRSVLEKQFRLEGANEIMFLGTLIHSIFDAALASQDFSKEAIRAETSRLFQHKQNLTEMYGLGVTEDEMSSKIEEKAACLTEWGQNFFKKEPHPIHGLIDFKNGATQRTTSNEKVAVCISNVVDIEECVWSPKFGLKGKVDATVEVKINREPNILKKKTTLCDTAILPLELKTGKLFSKLGSVEHRAQVILYSMLMVDRYANTMDTGLLYYLKAAHMLGVPAYLHEKRALVMKRNEMVQYLASTGTTDAMDNMPGMLQDERTCGYCPQLKVCTLYHKSAENGDRTSAGIGQLFDKMTSHLTATHLEYFLHWYHLISFESKAAKQHDCQSDVWCLSGLEREKLGYCFSNMTLVSCDQSHDRTGSDTQYINKFARQDPGSFPHVDMYLAKSDYVVVSQENGITALSTGFLFEVSEESVSVLMDKDLSKCYHHTTGSRDQRVLYRIDKAELSSGAMAQWSNLAKLFFADSERDAKLRRLIVELQPPRFSRQDDLVSDPASSQQSMPLSSQLSACSLPIKYSEFSDQLTSIFQNLNAGQRRAIEKVLAAEDYALILGMPGTGKTSTISCLVTALVTMGKSVLLTSYTHSAVDNILLKLKQSDVDFLRLGSVQKIHPDIQEYAVDNAAKHLSSVAELKEFYESKLVVATTCLGANHIVFNQRSFDYCIVDEASQVTQPVCIGSLRHSTIFVLVGDHYQLPPLVMSHGARDGGMDISLFKRLSESQPQSVANLEHQYRMHQDIMLLSNTLIYEHRLKCGTQEIAERLLTLPALEEFCEDIYRMEREQRFNCTWLTEVLNPNRVVVFLDTDAVPAQETRSGPRVYNESEAALVSTITQAFIKSGLQPENIGIISPYRHQLKIIKQHLCNNGEKVVDNFSTVEINTVDKYQGRDKSCVLVSLVRSNDVGYVGDLLRDWRRVNVALTRAKHKLILVGSKKTLKNNILFQELLTLAERHSWIYTLPKDAWVCERT